MLKSHFLRSQKRTDELRSAIQAIIAIKQACEQANISIPYPIRTLYYYNQEQDGDGFPASANADSAER